MGLLAVCLLGVSVNNAWAQWYCGPNDTICIGSWCEPVTTPAARQICPLRSGGGRSGGGGGGGGGGRHEQFRKTPTAKGSHPHVEYGAGRLTRPPATEGGGSGGSGGGGGGGGSGSGGGGGGGGGESAVNPPPPPAFDPQTSFQIKPLNCPSGLGLVTRSPTFYGGTRCGLPSPAAGGPQPPPQAGQAGQTDQTPKDDSEKEGYEEIRKQLHNEIKAAVDQVRSKYGLPADNTLPVAATKWSPPE